MKFAFAFLLAVSASAGAAPSAAKTHIVKIENIKFDPSHLDVHVGDTVIWKNNDLVPHTVTATTSSPNEKPAFDSKQLDSSKEFKLKIRKQGLQHYKCLFHPMMEGELNAQ